MALTAALDELPAAYRTVLVLRDVEGLSHLEIAELLGLSVPAVKTRVHRARLFARKHLGDAMATLDATSAATGRRQGGGQPDQVRLIASGAVRSETWRRGPRSPSPRTFRHALR
jgi:hypothetical protein